MATINSISTEEFKKHFNRLPIDYTSKTGIKYVTFITTTDIFQQLFMAHGIPTFDKVLKSTDRNGNECKMIFRKFHDPDNEFKMIVSILNTITGERIAIIAV